MKFYTKIPPALNVYFKDELQKYYSELDLDNLEQAWNHLERAHIIGQRYPFEHSLVHLKMMQFGFKIKSTKEVFGQIPRLVFGGIKSFVGKVPEGNPGGSNVPPLKLFPIDESIQEIFLKAGVIQK